MVSGVVNWCEKRQTGFFAVREFMFLPVMTTVFDSFLPIVI